MLNKFKLFKEESGQALILVALMMTVIMGFAALTIDLGRDYVTKSNLQKAADAAALAGAQDLASPITAKTEARNYAIQNKIDETAGDTVTVTAPYIDPSTGKSDKSKIEVVCTRKVANIFSRVLGLSETTVRATAIAQNNNTWDGESLPFLNVTSGFTPGSTINIWEKVDTGFFESLSKIDVVYEDDCFKISYSDGIEAKSGVVAEGTDKIITNLGKMWDAYVKSSETEKYVYVFSLSDAVFSNHYVETDHGKRSFEEEYKHDWPALGEDDNILLTQLVLLECTWDNFSKDGKIIQVTYHATYDLGNDGKVDYPNFPTEQDGSSSVDHIKLVR